jgi:hypothetical protein
VDTFINQSLECFLVKRQLEQVLPSQVAVLFRELSELAQHFTKFRHVEMGGCGRFIEQTLITDLVFNLEVLVYRVVELTVHDC